MFEQTIYSLLRAKYNDAKTGVEWKEEGVKALEIKNGKITKVTTDGDVVVEIDETTAFARRSTGMFDKLGVMLFVGDIVKFKHKHGSAEEAEILAPILWVNAAYCIIIEGIDEPVYLTQQNVLEIEKVGNVYANGAILETTIDEAIFKAQE